MLGLRFCARAFSSCSKRGPLLIAVRGPLTVAASLVAEHRLQTRRLSNCGSRAQLLRGMWDLPRPGLKPVSPALAGRLSTTAPPGKPSIHFYTLTLYPRVLLNLLINTHAFFLEHFRFSMYAMMPSCNNDSFTLWVPIFVLLILFLVVLCSSSS